MEPPLALLPGGPGPIAVPLLLIVGWYLLGNRSARIACLTMLGVWFVWIIVSVIISRDWNMLIFPAFVFIAWFLISEIDKSIG